MASSVVMAENGEKPAVVSDTVPYNKLDVDDKHPIGSGAFGAVYKAVHKDWGCLVAFKKLGIHCITDQRKIKDLKNEADIHRQLRHPNIVSMLGVVFEDNNYGLVLEYLCYGSLDKFLQNIKEKTGVPFQVSWNLKARMCSNVCSGMSYLHTLDPTPVIHGDLKLQNLLVGDHLKIKITDFGLSKWKDYSLTHTNAGMIQGTASHIPPEKWKNKDMLANWRFDVYSFGIVTWEMFSEKQAFDNCQGMIMPLVMNGERPALDKLPSDIPPKIPDLMSSCWKQEPEERPSFRELTSEFKLFTGGSERIESDIERAARDVLSICEKSSDTTQPISEHGQKMERVSQKLCSVIRRTDQILTYLLEEKALTSDECDEIRSRTTIYSIARRLVDVLGIKPVTAYQCFLNTLNKTNQHDLCRLVENGDDFNVDHREVLIDNYTFLKTNLNVSQTSLLDHLLQSRVLDEQEVEEIRSKKTEHERAEQLLQFITRTSHEQYQLFLTALHGSGSGFVADKLQQGLQIPQLIAKQRQQAAIQQMQQIALEEQCQADRQRKSQQALELQQKAEKDKAKQFLEAAERYAARAKQIELEIAHLQQQIAKNRACTPFLLPSMPSSGDPMMMALHGPMNSTLLKTNMSLQKQNADMENKTILLRRELQNIAEEQQRLVLAQVAASGDQLNPLANPLDPTHHLFLESSRYQPQPNRRF